MHHPFSRSLRCMAALLAGCLGCGAGGLAQAAPPSYRIVDLGAQPGFEDMWVSGIDDSGQVVGVLEQSSADGGGWCPYVWQPKTGVHRCETPLPAYSGRLYVNGINRAGVVAATRYDKGHASHAFEWSLHDGFQRLEKPGPGSLTTASHINDGGAVVGSATFGGPPHAVVWRPVDGLVDLHPPGYASSVGYGISDTGVVVGQAAKVEYWNRPVKIDSPGQFTVLPCLDNVMGDCSGRATAINMHAQVVGESQYSGDWVYHAFIWDSARGMLDLTAGGPYASLTSTAADINEMGQVVGIMSGRINGVLLLGPFYWSPSDGARFLADLIDPADPLAGRVEFLPDTAVAINRWGVIVVNAWVDDIYHARALVLTPVR